MASNVKRRVLVLGVYLLNARNTAPELARQFRNARDWEVDQRWAALGVGALPAGLEALTVLREAGSSPKFKLLNQLMRHVDLDRYAYVLVADDDIEVPSDFVDRYLALVDRYGLSLAQPARSHDSYIDHYFVAALNGVEARQTQFVEIGPLFSVARDAFDVLLPFDEDAPMGWGLDFVWPVILSKGGKRLGIVDAVPVRHALRKPVSHYSHGETEQKMFEFLKAHPHLTHAEAFLATETYPPKSGAQDQICRAENRK